MTQLRLAVFDCDGTLVDSQHVIIKTMTVTFEKYSLAAPDPESIRRVIGLPLERTISVLYPEADHNQQHDMAASYKQLFYEQRITEGIHEPLFPGVREIMETLSNAGWLLGVATGKARRGLNATLEPYGLLENFVTLQTADVAHGKPNPDMLYRAMSETGVDAANTVMIGDTTFDIEMACNAGTKSVGVSWGYHQSEELHEAGAQTVIEHFDDLPDVLEKIAEDEK